MAIAQTFDTLRLDQRGRVLTVGIDAPPYNYLTRTMQDDLLRLVRLVEHDEGIGAVIVTGAVPNRYITHYDIGDLLAVAEAAPAMNRPAARVLLGAVRALTAIGGERLVARSPLAGVLAVTRFHELAMRLSRSPAIWIAAIDGPCGGGGLEMAVFFDLRFASDRASFAVPELSIGLTTTVGAQRLSRMLGPSRTMRVLLDARTCGPAEALTYGLVDDVFPAEELMAEVVRAAERYARRPRAAVAAQKRILDDAHRLSARRVLTREGVAQLVGVPSAQTRRALRRWVDMQRPDGDSVFRTDPEPWSEGTAVDFHAPTG